MKKLLPPLLLFTTFIGSAQDTTTIDQYCRLIIPGWTTRITIDVDMGEKRKLSTSDAWLKDELTKSKRFNSVVDVLNYRAYRAGRL